MVVGHHRGGMLWRRHHGGGILWRGYCGRDTMEGAHCGGDTVVVGGICVGDTGGGMLWRGGGSSLSFPNQCPQPGGGKLGAQRS